jgi:biopolymer transport protein ExbB/TolQ
MGLSRRTIIGLISFALGCLFVTALHYGLSQTFAEIMLDKDSELGTYPFTIQNVQWVVFFVGMGDLLDRYLTGNEEASELGRNYLPTDERVVLRAQDLGGLYGKVKAHAEAQDRFLPRLIQRAILQFQSSRSIDQANTLLNSSLDLYLHEIDLRYNILRYISWVLPSLGFIGTVIGIAIAIQYAGITDPQDPKLLGNLARKLAVAFNTTIVALLQAMVLVFTMHVVQAREERALNRAGQYCVDNLINRLYEK